ncbi:ATP-binding protein [Propionivibrio sp.]|uniref:ATP-binding protein n=1 Tax=Propionivibrio sp. TaxID=2212460 RepID=UPI003BF23119
MSERTSQSSSDLSIRAEVNEVRRASAWLEQIGSELRVPSNQLERLDVCLNEALANLIFHGDSDDLAPVLLRVGVRNDGGLSEASVTLIDSGPPFDPTSTTPKPRAASLDEAGPGGLGLMMIRSFSDALVYRYTNGCNEFTFSVSWCDA